MKVSLVVNGSPREVDLPPLSRLLDALQGPARAHWAQGGVRGGRVRRVHRCCSTATPSTRCLVRDRASARAARDRPWRASPAGRTPVAAASAASSRRAAPSAGSARRACSSRRQALLAAERHPSGSSLREAHRRQHVPLHRVPAHRREHPRPSASAAPFGTGRGGAVSHRGSIALLRAAASTVGSVALCEIVAERAAARRRPVTLLAGGTDWVVEQELEASARGAAGGPSAPLLVVDVSRLSDLRGISLSGEHAPGGGRDDLPGDAPAASAIAARAAAPRADERGTWARCRSRRAAPSAATWPRPRRRRRRRRRARRLRR